MCCLRQPSNNNLYCSYTGLGSGCALDSHYLNEHYHEILFSFSLKTSLKEVTTSLGPDFAQVFRPANKDDLCPLPEQLNDMMSVFSMGVFINSLGLDPHDEDPRVPLLSLQVRVFINSLGLDPHDEDPRVPLLSLKA